MALLKTVAARVALTNAAFVAPLSVTSEWVNVIDAGGMIVLDAAVITNPDTQIVSASRSILTFTGRAGTLVCARMGYTGTPSVNAAIVAFGRVADEKGIPLSAWELLPNLQATTTTGVTLTTSVATDVSDGTNSYTLVDPLIHTWDRRGNNEVIFGVTTIFATTSSALAATAFLQAKAL